MTKTITAKQEAIAQADAFTNNAGLPTYSEVLQLLANAADRLERLDSRLMRLTGLARDCDLGEVTRARAALAKVA